jgi:hypothetical protein
MLFTCWLRKVETAYVDGVVRMFRRPLSSMAYLANFATNPSSVAAPVIWSSGTKT